ncbi:BcPDE2, cAMP phosphodiesterase [Calycina marina]|uniref:Phosphodiesterase n=1 Tax=Calycina marina TaxID=1763456 RepID=A0A9P7Z3E8_9HELO|nr:BcPDE2, cAMP phosphodiesterase [Calycina marina]
MDFATCNVVYVDRAALEDTIVRKGNSPSPLSDGTPTPSTPDDIDVSTTGPGPLNLQRNIETLLHSFSEVHICTSGSSCIEKLADLNLTTITSLIPTLVLIDVPYNDQLEVRTLRETREPSPGSQSQVDGMKDASKFEEPYGLRLLQWVSSEIQYHSLSKLFVPVALVAVPEAEFGTTARTLSNAHTDGPSLTEVIVPLDQIKTMSYLDVGAIDVLTSPLLQERLSSLGIHAYRAHREASRDHSTLLDIKRGRKRSWVGVNDDQKPYAYLREAMVSGLMDGICKPGDDPAPLGHKRISIAANRQKHIADAIGSWDFSAHEFSDDELLHAALLMLQHALSMPDLVKWRISTEHLTGFLVASRSAYNDFVPYHNFRHVVDVLQAVFHFLVQLGRLPEYPSNSSKTPPKPSPISALIRPFDALTLLITAIGHDVGHPGVNNAFLVTLNAPLAQLYNDRSVLESFHCAAYSQILRRHWPTAFQDPGMRSLMISSILATDMGLHFDYIKQLGNLQEKLQANPGADGWNGRFTEEQRSLACSLLIKCADISNVARTHEVATKWTNILIDEFSRQAEMEKDLDIPTALFAAPATEIVALAKSQIGFMNMFAIPLFQGVADIMPLMQYCVDELQNNIRAWEGKIVEERAREDNDLNFMTDGMFSPRSLSIAVPAAEFKSRNNDLGVSVMANSNFNKNPFKKDFLDEGAGLGMYHSLPDILTTNFIPESDKDPTEDPSMENYFSDEPEAAAVRPRRLMKKPEIASVSAPAQLDKSGSVGVPDQRNIDIVSPPATVLVDATPTIDDGSEFQDKQQMNDAADRTSQATSATTSKMPLSPYTPGTSVMSQDSVEKQSVSTSAGGLKPVHSEATSSLTNETEDTNENKHSLRGLRKKASS